MSDHFYYVEHSPFPIQFHRGVHDIISQLHGFMLQAMLMWSIGGAIWSILNILCSFYCFKRWEFSGAFTILYSKQNPHRGNRPNSLKIVMLQCMIPLVDVEWNWSGWSGFRWTTLLGDNYTIKILVTLHSNIHVVVCCKVLYPHVSLVYSSGLQTWASR